MVVGFSAKALRVDLLWNSYGRYGSLSGLVLNRKRSMTHQVKAPFDVLESHMRLFLLFPLLPDFRRQAVSIVLDFDDMKPVGFIASDDDGSAPASGIANAVDHGVFHQNLQCKGRKEEACVPVIGHHSKGISEPLLLQVEIVVHRLYFPARADAHRFFQHIPAQWRSFLEGSQGKERKNALQLLEEMVKDGNVALCDDALQLAMENGRTDTDSVRQCYYLIARKEYRPEPLVLHNPPVMNYNPNLTAYDSLMGGEQHG